MADPDSGEQGHAAAPPAEAVQKGASLDTVRLSHQEIAAQLRAAGVEEALIDRLGDQVEEEKATPADDD
jgi:hypothetical protein